MLNCPRINGKIIGDKYRWQTTSGRIVEVEAYNGIADKTSHAFGDRRTNRTEIMYAEGGVTYVYLCYGIHHLFNVVTNKKDISCHSDRLWNPSQVETMLIEQRKELDFHSRGRTIYQGIRYFNTKWFRLTESFIATMD